MGSKSFEGPISVLCGKLVFEEISAPSSETQWYVARKFISHDAVQAELGSSIKQMPAC